MSQSHKHSFYESILNVAVGYSIALLSQILVFSAYHIDIPLDINAALCFWLTLVSIARSYLIRRYFNRMGTENESA